MDGNGWKLDQISARAAMKAQTSSTLHKQSERIEENGMEKNAAGFPLRHKSDTYRKQ